MNLTGRYKVDQERDKDREEILERIRLLVEEGDELALGELLEGIHPADIADYLREIEDNRILIIKVLNPEKASEVLSETGDDFRAELLEDLDEPLIREIFHEMADDDAADIVGELPDEETERVLKIMDSEDQEEVKVLLEYDEESAGGIMTSELVSVEEDFSVHEAMDTIRKQAREVDDFFVVFVTDCRKNLKGTVALRDLIIADLDGRISRIMDDNVVSVPPDMDQEDVARLMSRYNLVTVPVTDESKKLIGRITVDDILDIVEAEVTEDLLRMGGTDVDEEIYGGTASAVRFRVPWLLLNLITAFMAAAVVGFYTDTLKTVIVLAIFMPVIAGLGGNAATQSLAVTLRRLTLGELSSSTKSKIIRKELLAGTFNGILVGIAVGGVASLIAMMLGERPHLGMVVGLAMFLTIGFAGLIGAFIPITLKDLGFDPAVASSVFITTFTDLVGFFLLLGLGTLLLSYLI
jgi:magnesium transporter